jgi:hypothetical protein
MPSRCRASINANGVRLGCLGARRHRGWHHTRWVQLTVQWRRDERMKWMKKRKTKGLTCDMYGGRRRVHVKDDFCVGCRRIVCVKCCLAGGHYMGGRHA